MTTRTPIEWKWYKTARQWDAHHRGWLLIVYRTDVFRFVADHYDHLTGGRRQIRGEAKSLKAAQAAVIAAVDAARKP
jgi:hypothetical protein